MGPHSRDYEGLTFAEEGRAKVVADLEARGLLHAIEDHEVEIGHSDRSKLPIEPYLSDQWFVQTGDVRTERRSHEATEGEGAEGKRDGVVMGNGSIAPGLAQAAMEVVQDGRIQVYPSRYAKSYLDWLGEKRDWCISRQLWWGHRIPAWSEPLGGRSDDGWGEDAIRKIRALDETLKRWRREGRLATLVRDWGPAPTIRPQDHLLAEEYICPNPDDDEVREFVRENGFVEEADVLDTWFSSALWPFSTLGWPEETEHLKQYYPGRVLCTSRDIITNWVARMVMFGLYSMGEVPFDEVYIHPKILDGRGETMSKSKGNGVDPVDIIQTHGADALRYSMADMCTETQDIRMPVDYICPHCGKLTEQSGAVKGEEQARKSRGEKLDRKVQPADCTRVKCRNSECGWEFATQWADETVKKELGLARETSEKFEIGRNFCNKLWNAGRYALMNLEGTPYRTIDVVTLPPEDRWILARLSQTIRSYHACLRGYQFSASVRELRVFFWESLCDWYIELTKPRMATASTEATRGTVRQVLAFCLDQVFRLFHPTIPFITEYLWQRLNEVVPRRGLPGVVELRAEGALAAAAFPPVEGYPSLEDARILETFGALQNATRGVRDLRTACNVPPRQKVGVTVVVPEAHRNGFTAHAHILRHMAGVGELKIVSDGRRPRNAGSVTIEGLRIFVHDISDDEADRTRTTRALADADKQIESKEAKLRNEKFIANAKSEVIEAERERLQELHAQRTALRQHLSELEIS